MQLHGAGFHRWRSWFALDLKLQLGGIERWAVRSARGLFVEDDKAPTNLPRAERTAHPQAGPATGLGELGYTSELADAGGQKS